MAGGTQQTRDVLALAALTQGVHEGQEGLLRRGLDWLARLVRFDLAAVFELAQGELHLRLARGPLADNRVTSLALRLDDFPTIRAALETRRARAFTESDHAHGDGDPFDGVLDLPPGHACMVVPLAAGERVFGVLTLDRSECETYPPGVVELVEVYGQVLALALQNAEQREVLERMHQQDHDHAKLLEAELVGDPAGILETSRHAGVRAVVARARQVAESETPVFLLGEAGTGKVRLARAIHLWSRRADQPFVTLHCAGRSAEELRRELFGEVAAGDAGNGERGVRPGRLELARGGSLLLGEVETLPPALQQQLLRVLKERVSVPVGGTRPREVDVRIMVTCGQDPALAVARGRLDEELYYRLSGYPLELPPLRERMEDLPLLCRFLLSEFAHRTGRPTARVSSAGLEKLSRHAWPGNLRELGNVLERALLLSRSEVLGPDCLALPMEAPAPGGSSPTAVLRDPVPLGKGSVETLEEVEKRHIARVLALCGGRIYGEGGAARLLGLKPSTLQSRMKKLGLSRLEP